MGGSSSVSKYSYFFVLFFYLCSICLQIFPRCYIPIFDGLVLLQFTRYCVEKNWAKNCARGRKTTNIRQVRAWIWTKIKLHKFQKNFGSWKKNSFFPTIGLSHIWWRTGPHRRVDCSRALSTQTQTVNHHTVSFTPFHFSHIDNW